ncbi:MAG: hypothetical protein ACI9YT_000395 [Halobacteriales archaeon]|jgi:hypothetical protein
MSREIRITIDDDEIFERMKRRKQQLDLSWEEVLHRGLRREPEGGQERSAAGRDRWSWDERPPRDPEPPESGTSRGPPDEPFSTDEFVEEMKRGVRNQVVNSLQSSLSGLGEGEFDLEEEMGALQSAEDAVLVFDFLDGDGSHEDEAFWVPLRVTQQTSREGLDVDVVAVRSGKSVSHMNHFDRSGRRQVNANLAAGETATLRFTDGGDGEEYRVYPVLSWSKDESGRPTVTSVEIDEVVLDDVE